MAFGPLRALPLGSEMTGHPHALGKDYRPFPQPARVVADDDQGSSL